MGSVVLGGAEEPAIRAAFLERPADVSETDGPNRGATGRVDHTADAGTKRLGARCADTGHDGSRE